MTPKQTDTPTPIIRKATSEDVDTVARIWHSGWRDGHIGYVPPDLVQHRQLHQFVTRTRERIPSTWIAEADSQVLGFVVVIDDEVEQLYVDGPARGTGVAAALLRKGQDEIRKAGHRRAWLAVATGNARARAFYSREGWRDAGELTYMAETEAGPFPVPTHRYEIDLA